MLLIFIRIHTFTLKNGRTLMKISKELIEKYHRDECTAEERGWVEEWLFSAEADDELVLPAGEDKAIHQQEIWNGLSDLFAEKGEESAVPVVISQPGVQAATPPAGRQAPKKRATYALWYRSVAAAAIFGLLGISWYIIRSKVEPHLVTVDNTSSFDVRYLDSNGYGIAVGPNTEAKINYHTGFIDFSGSLMISPKEDIELIFHGDKEKVSFKMGQTYIILKDKKGGDKIIVVNERNLLDLPPVIQKRVTTEFNI